MNIVANVSKINGEVYALRGNEKILLQIGSPLADDDTVITEDSSLEITFTDKTQVTLSEDTEIMISDYVFTQTDESFLLSITKGTMQSISGEIVKRNPEAFEIQSPKATMGIRGTTTLHTISDNGDENHVVLSISDGHTVHINTKSGSFALLTSSSEGVVIGSGGTAVTPFVLSTTELNEIIQLMDNMDNPQDVLQQLNIKLKQIQDNEDTSSTEGQNLQSVTEAIDNITQEGKQLSVVTEEAIIPSNNPEQINEDDQSQENNESETEGLAQEFEESTQAYQEKDSSANSQQNEVLGPSFESSPSQQESLDPEIQDPPAIPLEPSTPIPPTPPSPSYTEIMISPEANKSVTFILNDGTEMKLGQFNNNASSFTFYIEQLGEIGSGGDDIQGVTGTVNLHGDGFSFEYKNEEYKIIWQDDSDDIVLITGYPNMYNKITGLEEYSFNDPSVMNFKYIFGDYSNDSKAEFNNTHNDTFNASTNTLGFGGAPFYLEGFSVIDGGTNPSADSMNPEEDILIFTAGADIVFKTSDDDGSCIHTFDIQDSTNSIFVRYDNFEQIIFNSTEAINVTLTSINENYQINVKENTNLGFYYAPPENADWTFKENIYTYTNENGVSFTIELNYIP